MKLYNGTLCAPSNSVIGKVALEGCIDGNLDFLLF